MRAERCFCLYDKGFYKFSARKPTDFRPRDEWHLIKVWDFLFVLNKKEKNGKEQKDGRINIWDTF